MDFLTLLQKTSEDKVAPVGYRVHGCKFSSASALGNMFHLSYVLTCMAVSIFGLYFFRYLISVF